MRALFFVWVIVVSLPFALILLGWMALGAMVSAALGVFERPAGRHDPDDDQEKEGE